MEPKSGHHLAKGIPMSKTWRLRFEVLFYPDSSTAHRTIFHITDGGKYGSKRCGGRIPGVWTENTAPPIRLGS